MPGLAGLHVDVQDGIFLLEGNLIPRQHGQLLDPKTAFEKDADDCPVD